jgi:hypothetical protein
MILPEGLIRGGFHIFDIDPRLGLSFYRMKRALGVIPESGYVRRGNEAREVR